MSVNVEEVNAELSTLIDSYAAGTLAAGEYRQRRRELVCKISGEAVPDVESVGSAECTLPGGMTAVNVSDSPVAEKINDECEKHEPTKSKALYWFVTVITLLVAVAGVAGLFWYIFR
jgi:hypothetical protein